MTLSEIEKKLEKVGSSRTEVVKITFVSDEVLKKSIKGEVMLFKGVPAELLEFIAPNKYVVLFKAASMRAYIRKQKNEIN
jgi:enamine deaminase RidA (YjgF/YER057c/UK114 family)